MTRNKNTEENYGSAVRHADAHDAWFRERVLEALQDHRPTVPHKQVMAEAQELLERKRQARAYGNPT